MKKPKFTLLGILMLTCLFANGQTAPRQLVSSAGETFKNSICQIDWSIGELSTETYTGNINMITQGFHQGIYIITSIEQISDLQLEITAFPNPAADFIYVKIGSEEIENFQFSISDMSGNIIQTGKFTENQQQISLAGKSTGTYMLYLFFENNLVKSFKIIKIQ